MIRALLVLTAASLPALAWGQDIDPERFVPFEPGDRWEYEAVDVNQTAQDNDGNPTTSTSFHVVHVERDTTIDGEEWAIYSVDTYRADKTPLGQSRCVGRYVRVSRGDRELTELDVRDGSDSGCSFDLRSYFFAQRSEDVTVEIGSGSYPVAATEEWVSFFTGSGGTSVQYSSTHAVDIGRVSYEYSNVRQLSPTYSYTTDIRLLYAEVGGVAYGTRAVAVDAPPVSPPTLSVSAFPNPGVGSLRLRVEGATSGRLSVEVVDAVGRSVWSGALRASGAGVDVPFEAWGSGLYIVRVRDAAGATAVVRVTRL